MVEARRTRITLRTSAGEVNIETWYGRDPEAGCYLCPMRVRWGLEPRQKMTPVLEDRLCYTATRAGSYEAAAEVAAKWGCRADDATIHRHVEQAGARSQALADQRVQRALDPATRGEVVAEARGQDPRGGVSLILMADGWMVRERGPEWGLKPPEKQADRVGWHEMKTGLVFRAEARARTHSDRPLLLEKFTVATRGDAHEFGRCLYAEALRRGLHQARKVYVVADGAVWIWKIAEDRFSDATGVLDLFHASQHLWAVAHALHGEETTEAAAWVKPMLHQLNHGGEAEVVEKLEGLLQWCGELDQARRERLEQNVAYFQNHRDHVHYERVEAEGCPKGSGAMESMCAQLQGRFKRPGQFWTLPGQTSLLALELARRNEDWDEIWELAA